MRNFRYLLYPCRDHHVSREDSFPSSPPPPPSPLTSPPLILLKHVDGILPRSSPFAGLPSTGSCSGGFSRVLRLVVMGLCLIMIPILKAKILTKPHIPVVQLPRAESLCRRRELAGRM